MTTDGSITPPTPTEPTNALVDINRRIVAMSRAGWRVEVYLDEQMKVSRPAPGLLARITKRREVRYAVPLGGRWLILRDPLGPRL